MSDDGLFPSDAAIEVVRCGSHAISFLPHKFNRIGADAVIRLTELLI